MYTRSAMLVIKFQIKRDSKRNQIITENSSYIQSKYNFQFRKDSRKRYTVDKNVIFKISFFQKQLLAMSELI